MSKLDDILADLSNYSYRLGQGKDIDNTLFELCILAKQDIQKLLLDTIEEIK